MKFYNDFIGEEHTNKTFKFITGDEEERFLKNCETQPDDWYYRNIDISYEYNSYGHRSPDISQVDFDNYILFSGCSHTVGVGLELEKTYPYLLSKALNCSYYNLAIPATGIDIVEYNVVSWLFKFPKKPKLIVIQWPDFSRFTSCLPGYENLLQNGSWSNDEYVKKLLASADITGFMYARRKISSDLLLIAANKIPVLSFNYANQVPVNHRVEHFRRLDYARDISHSGMKSHEMFAKTLLELLPGDFNK